MPDSSIRRLITGLIFAGSGAIVAVSPIGKLSGSHINPSVSLAFWIHGKMHLRDFVGFVIGQFLGAIAAVLLLVTLWGDYARSVSNGMTLPGLNYPLWVVFFSEVTITFLLVLTIFIFVSHHRLMRWTPLVVWLLIAGMVWQEAPISGTSLNPARSFAPALVSGNWHHQWIYGIAPPMGAAMPAAVNNAVGAFRLIALGERDVLTGKLCYAFDYPSIFKNVKLPHFQHHPHLHK
ncbi:MIP/aquaporin family protein [uncultured Nostoc sp.]|uniref:MIP/aquaporin family protein n=1 Tax=uncultured Nostoc sp. TaxID=340711 RepID=UPI0035CA0BC6